MVSARCVFVLSNCGVDDVLCGNKGVCLRDRPEGVEIRAWTLRHRYLMQKRENLDRRAEVKAFIGTRKEMEKKFG